MGAIENHDVKKVFKIEGVVNFNPERNTLSAVGENVETSLFSAGAAILLLLIQNHGQLVKHSDLTYEGWEKHGLHVSNNTFYQNILNLRKCIRNCGINTQVIRTIPRKGLMIPSEISIVEVLLNERSNPQQSDQQTDQQTDQLSYSADLDIYLAPKKSIIKSDKNKQGKEKTTSSKTMVMTYIFIGFLCLFGGFRYGLLDDYTSRYSYMDFINGCQVYIQEGDDKFVSYDKFLRSNNISCESNEFVYFTTYKYIPRTSIIKCKNSLSDRNKYNSCTSFYYVDK